jgi:hypothetical protein
MDAYSHRHKGSQTQGFMDLLSTSTHLAPNARHTATCIHTNISHELVHICVVYSSWCLKQCCKLSVTHRFRRSLVPLIYVYTPLESHATLITALLILENRAFQLVVSRYFYCKKQSKCSSVQLYHSFNPCYYTSQTDVLWSAGKDKRARGLLGFRVSISSSNILLNRENNVKKSLWLCPQSKLRRRPIIDKYELMSYHKRA